VILFDFGDEVILFMLYWMMYFEVIKFVGGVLVDVFVGVDVGYFVIVD